MDFVDGRGAGIRRGVEAVLLVSFVVMLLGGAQARADEQTPEDFKFGIGVGWDFPADLQVPNVVVASFRHKHFEIEPFLVLSSSKSEDKADDGIVSSEDSASEKTQGFGAVVKYAFMRRGDVELQFVGSLSYSRSTSVADPDGPSNRAETKAKELSLSYGLGLQWWFARNFSLRATATNPIFSDTTTKANEEQVGGVLVTESKNRSYGIVWDPNIVIAIMTWF